MIDGNATLSDLPKARFVDEPSIMRLLSLLPIDNIGAFGIQFTSPANGTGVSSITRDFAVVACKNLGLKVLLVSLGGVQGSVRETVENRYHLDNYEISAASPFTAEAGFPLVMVEVSTVRLSIAMLQGQERCEVFLPKWIDFLEESKNNFDLILIDSLPLNRSFAAVTLCSKVDANIIVVAAEDTSIVSTKNLMNRLEEKHGHVLGCILNKRHFHIPGFIYKKV